MPSTAELVKKAQVGEIAAFAELVRRYERAAILTAYAVLGDFHASEDAAQEAFVLGYRLLGRLRQADAFGPWLLRIVRRRALRLLASRKSEPIASDGMDRAAEPPGEWIEAYREVVEQIARLPEHERLVAVMRYVDGRTMREIAEATGRPEGTITKQLSRAIERLRHWFIEVRS